MTALSGGSVTCDPIVPGARPMYHGFRGYLLKLLGKELPEVARLGQL